MKRGAQGARIVTKWVRSVELHSARAFCKSNYARVITAQWSARVNVSIKRKRKKTRGGGSVKGGKGERRKKQKDTARETERKKHWSRAYSIRTRSYVSALNESLVATKAACHRVSQTLIWITKTARGIPLSGPDLLYSFSCLASAASLFLSVFSYRFISFPPSSFPSPFSFLFFVFLFSSFLSFFFFFFFFLFRPATTYQSTYSTRFMCHLWRSRATKMEIAVKENYVEVGFNHRRELNDRHSDGTLRARNAIVPRSSWSTFWRDNFREICGDARHPASIAVHRWLSFDEMRLSAIVLCPRAKWEFRYAPLYALVFTAGDRVPPRRWRGYRRIIVRHNETRTWRKKFDC